MHPKAPAGWRSPGRSRVNRTCEDIREGPGVRRPSAVLQHYGVTPAEPFCADSKHASSTRCVCSAHLGHSSFNLPEKTWLAKLRNMTVFCAVAWPRSARSEPGAGVGAPVGTRISVRLTSKAGS